MRTESTSLGGLHLSRTASAVLATVVASTAIAPAARAQDESTDDHTRITTTIAGLLAPPPYEGPDAIDVTVQTDGDFGAYLMEAAPGGGSVGWAQLCMLPCRAKLDPKREYKIGGLEVAESDPFHLASGTTHELYVHPSPAGARAIGWIFFLLGGAMTAVGSVLVLGAPSSPADSDQSTGAEEARSSRTARFVSGGVILGVGVPFFIAGLAVLFGTSSTTSVREGDGTKLAQQGWRITEDVSLTPTGLVF